MSSANHPQLLRCNMIKALSPSEVIAANKSAVASKAFDVVTGVFNSLLQEAFDGKSAVITQSAAVEAVARTMGIPRDEVFSNGYLNVEHSFRRAGWRCNYVKPDFNSLDEARFIFEPKNALADDDS